MHLNMFTYTDVHFKYTLPVVTALTLIIWPFINRSEVFKIVLISAVSLIYTTPWNNYIAYDNAWTYTTEKDSIGHGPIDEYVFFIVQIVMTSLWAFICLRGYIPCLKFNTEKWSYELIRWIPILILSTTAIVGYKMIIPEQNTFYLGCILFWMSPISIFMWYGGGNYFVKMIIPSSIAIVVPTLYLCWVDRMAGLKDLSVRSVVETTSFQNNMFTGKDIILPLEKTFFLFITNTLVVLSACCYDKARGMMVTYTLEFPERFCFSWKFMNQMFRAFATSEYSMPSIVIQDINGCMDIITTYSKTFLTGSYFFHSGVRLDLNILYAFNRITDEMIDDQPDDNMKIQNLELCMQFIKELFADRKSDTEVRARPYETKIDWIKYQTKLTKMQMSVFRAFSRIAFYMPRKSLDDQFLCLKWDVEERLYKNEDDIMEYADLLLGSCTGNLCTYILMYRCDDAKYELVENYSHVIKQSRIMGKGLQFVNIARDIITDSIKLGRCYVPNEYMDNAEEELRILCNEKNPRSLGNKKLVKYSRRFIQLADKFYLESLDGISGLPYETRGPMLALIDIYRGFNNVIQSSPIYPAKVTVSKRDQILIGLHSMYIKNIKYLI